MTDILVDKNQSEDQEQSDTPPVADLALGLAATAYGLIHILLRAKPGTGIIIRDFHPELGEVNEERVYSGLRLVVLNRLRQCEQTVILSLAERLLPRLLAPLITGQEPWDKHQQDGAERLRSEFDAAVVEADLEHCESRFRRLLNDEYDQIEFILDETMRRHEEQNQSEHRDPPGGEYTPPPDPADVVSQLRAHGASSRESASPRKYRVKATWQDIRDVCYEIWDQRQLNGDNYRPSMNDVVPVMRDRGFSISKGTIINRFKDAGFDYPGPRR